MKLKFAVFAALVGLLKVLAETYAPGFPISVELINTLLLALLALVGVDVVEFSFRNTRFGALLK
jgi:hypothetical protein